EKATARAFSHRSSSASAWGRREKRLRHARAPIPHVLFSHRPRHLSTSFVDTTGSLEISREIGGMTASEPVDHPFHALEEAVAEVHDHGRPQDFQVTGDRR